MRYFLFCWVTSWTCRHCTFSVPQHPNSSLIVIHLVDNVMPATYAAGKEINYRRGQVKKIIVHPHLRAQVSGLWRLAARYINGRSCEKKKWSLLYFAYARPSKLVWAATILACIRNVPCSSLGRDIDYPDWGFSWRSSISSGKFRDIS
jgi:hypothetical protein